MKPTPTPSQALREIAAEVRINSTSAAADGGDPAAFAADTASRNREAKERILRLAHECARAEATPANWQALELAISSALLSASVPTIAEPLTLAKVASVIVSRYGLAPDHADRCARTYDLAHLVEDVGPLYTAPPNAAALLREARDLIEQFGRYSIVPRIDEALREFEPPTTHSHGNTA